MASLADNVANLVVQTFKRLPSRGKPCQRSNGVGEWTVLAGIVVETPEHELKCVSLATGLKSTPNSLVKEACGKILHDSHAEILTIRAFNEFLLNETSKTSKFIEKASAPYLFQAVPGLRIHLYISAAPCGDASLGLLSEQGTHDEWTEPLVPIAPGGPLRGREHFYHVGYVRTKPGRRDSPITLSKSCSDKLAMKTATSLLLGPTSNIISPKGFYLSSLIIPESEFREVDVERAFGPTGRLQNFFMENTIYGHYSPHMFKVLPTDVTFMFQRTENTKPCPQSVLYTWNEDDKDDGRFKKSVEVLNSGVKIGNKPTSGKGQSKVSRWDLYSAVQAHLPPGVKPLSYLEFKKQNHDRLQMKQEIYKHLKNWIPTGEDDFHL